MKIFNFFLIVKIVTSSVSELPSDNDDISGDLLLVKKRALPSEFDKETRFKIESFAENCRHLIEPKIEFSKCTQCNNERCCRYT